MLPPNISAILSNKDVTRSSVSSQAGHSTISADPSCCCETKGKNKILNVISHTNQSQDIWKICSFVIHALDNYITFLSRVYHRITKRGLFICKPHSPLITRLALICSLAPNLRVPVFCRRDCRPQSLLQ